MTIHRDRYSRRTFLAAASATVLVGASPRSAHSDIKSGSAQTFITGNGEWTYEVVPEWGALPAGTSFGGTHGAIAQDNAGNIYVSTQSQTGILVYTSEGRLLKSIAHQFPEVHSMVHSVENGEAYIYATIQKGMPDDNWFFIKMRTDGTPILKITAPPQAGFKTKNEWRLTAALPAPDGSILIANGYGDSRIFRFDHNGTYLKSYSRKGSEPGLLNCCHGLALDTRYDQPLLLVCDRENRRLCHFDLDGKYVGSVSEHLRRPCQVGFYGDCAIVSELEGRVAILDRDNVPIAFMGDNPQKVQWANYNLDPRAIAPAIFSAAHGCFVDHDANIYISDWNHIGRVTKLRKFRN